MNVKDILTVFGQIYIILHECPRHFNCFRTDLQISFYINIQDILTVFGQIYKFHFSWMSETFYLFSDRFSNFIWYECLRHLNYFRTYLQILYDRSHILCIKIKNKSYFRYDNTSKYILMLKLTQINFRWI